MKLHHQHGYVVNILSDDHPGIVAAASKAIHDAGGSIDTCSQTVVAGYFTLIMVVSFPEPTDQAKLRQAVADSAGTPDGFQVQIRPYEPGRTPAGPNETGGFVLTAFGPPREDTILRFSRLLAHKSVNILDLYGDQTEQRFVLIGQLFVPPGTDVSMLQTDLEHLALDLGYTVRLQHENVFVATNQLRLSQLR